MGVATMAAKAKAKSNTHLALLFCLEPPFRGTRRPLFSLHSLSLSLVKRPRCLIKNLPEKGWLPHLRICPKGGEGRDCFSRGEAETELTMAERKVLVKDFFGRY